ncbi:spermatogenesis-defective protein 39 [Trichonephila clavata]|uniref:Spermatogenesis-defective protein 39 n=1 Tax=Trichonephila clavata TaxID=2740835 RepID=A0A8X6L8R7_TRICU|nr:spermatogenesis-defective protein 39 [Trichonephila clavata]
MKTMWKDWCQNLQDLTDFEVSRWRRVAPLKKLTLPPLELLAAVIAARLLCVVQPHFPCAKTYLWTDSLIVLHWIKSSKRRKQFVNNRVQEIKQKTSPANWYHCPGNQNPADKITHGCSVKQLSQDNSWKFGPPWLSDFKSSWPMQENLSICCDSEESCSMCCESDNYDNSESDIPVFNCAVNKPILNVEDFSTLRRLLQVTSFVFRFIYNTRNSNNRRSGPITSSETSKALIYFIKMSQENSFSSEINNVKLNNTHFQSGSVNQFLQKSVVEHKICIEDQIVLEDHRISSDENNSATDKLFVELTGKKELYDSSILCNLIFSLLYFYNKPKIASISPTSVKTRYNFSPKQYTWCALRVLAALKKWADIEELFLSKNWLSGVKMRSCIGFVKVLDILAKRRAPPEVVYKYISCLEDQSLKLPLAKIYKCHSYVIEALQKNKDRLGLLEYRNSLPPHSIDYSIATNILDNVIIKWKN